MLLDDSPSSEGHTLIYKEEEEEEANDFVSLSFYQWQQTNPSIQRGGRTLSQSQ